MIEPDMIEQPKPGDFTEHKIHYWELISVVYGAISMVENGWNPTKGILDEWRSLAKYKPQPGVVHWSQTRAIASKMRGRTK